MNNWNSWLVTRYGCHQGGWAFLARNQLFLSLCPHSSYLVPATLTFRMDHGYSFLTALPAKFPAPLPSMFPIIHSPPSLWGSQTHKSSQLPREHTDLDLSCRAFLIKSQFNFPT